MTWFSIRSVLMRAPTRTEEILIERERKNTSFFSYEPRDHGLLLFMVPNKECETHVVAGSSPSSSQCIISCPGYSFFSCIAFLILISCQKNSLGWSLHYLLGWEIDKHCSEPPIRDCFERLWRNLSTSGLLAVSRPFVVVLSSSFILSSGFLFSVQRTRVSERISRVWFSFSSIFISP